MGVAASCWRTWFRSLLLFFHVSKKLNYDNVIKIRSQTYSKINKISDLQVRVYNVNSSSIYTCFKLCLGWPPLQRKHSWMLLAKLRTTWVSSSLGIDSVLVHLEEHAIKIYSWWVLSNSTHIKCEIERLK